MHTFVQLFKVMTSLFTHKFSELLVADTPMGSLEALRIQMLMSLCVDITEADG